MYKDFFELIIQFTKEKKEALNATYKKLNEIRKQKKKSRADFDVVLEEDTQAVDEGVTAAEEN